MAPLNIEVTSLTLLMSHLERSASNAAAVLNTAEVDVGGTAKRKKKKWLGLYVSTTQNRQDNLLFCIVVTLDVFQFETSELKYAA